MVHRKHLKLMCKYLETEFVAEVDIIVLTLHTILSKHRETENNPLSVKQKEIQLIPKQYKS